MRQALRGFQGGKMGKRSIFIAFSKDHHHQDFPSQASGVGVGLGCFHLSPPLLSPRCAAYAQETVI